MKKNEFITKNGGTICIATNFGVALCTKYSDFLLLYFEICLISQYFIAVQTQSHADVNYISLLSVFVSKEP